MDSNKTKSVSYTERLEEKRENKSVPKGAKIVSKSVSTSTEKIENGYLLIKSYDITYENKNKEREYSYYTEKTYSKEDPLKKIKNLSEMFSEDEDDDFNFEN